MYQSWFWCRRWAYAFDLHVVTNVYDVFEHRMSCVFSRIAGTWNALLMFKWLTCIKYGNDYLRSKTFGWFDGMASAFTILWHSKSSQFSTWQYISWPIFSAITGGEALEDTTSSVFNRVMVHVDTRCAIITWTDKYKFMYSFVTQNFALILTLSCLNAFPSLCACCSQIIETIGNAGCWMRRIISYSFN